MHGNHACITSALSTGVRTALIISSTLVSISVANAIPFSTDISILGSTSFDTGFGTGPTTGDFGVTEGGTTTLSTFTGSLVTGSDPLTGTLTDVGDGVGFSGMVSAVDAAFSIGIDNTITVSNSSATDPYAVVFKLDFSNMVDAGIDGFSYSEMTLDVDGSEVFFSHLESDTLLGDAMGDRSTKSFDPTGTFGDLLTDTDSLLFTLTLAPTDLVSLDFIWTLVGDDFAGGTTSADLSTFLSIDSVTSLAPPPPPALPEPSSLLLFGIGLLGLPMARNVRKRSIILSQSHSRCCHARTATVTTTTTRATGIS